MLLIALSFVLISCPGPKEPQTPAGGGTTPTVEPTKPGKPSKPGKPGKPVKPTPSTPGKPSKPGKPTAPVVDGTNFTPQRETKSNYVEAINSFDDGGAKYYLITQDSAKAGLTEVQYKGKTYQLESVQVKTENDDLSSVTFTNKNGSSAGNLFSAEGANATVFIDDGIYKFSIYTGLSGPNNSYVGLSDVDVSNGEEPKVILHKTKYPATGWSAPYAGQERILLNGRNTYIENIAFDAQGRNMNPGWIEKNRGDALIYVYGADSSDSMNLVMKDIVIQNVGEKPIANIKNKGLEIFCVSGQSNFENIKFKNIKTARGLAPLHIVETDNANLKNVYIDMSETHQFAYPIKIETSYHHAASYIKGALTSASDQTVTFAGDIQFSKRSNPSSNMDPFNAIYVERYQYDKVEVPEDFNWAIWCQENGEKGEKGKSGESGKDSRPSFMITKNYPVRDAVTGKTSFGGHTTDLVLHDLRDDYWVIDYGKFAKSSSREDKRNYIEQELEQILRVIKYTEKNVLIPAKGRDPYTDEAFVGTNKAEVPRAPRAKIKIVGDLIPGFTVPDGYADYDTDIVAVDNKEDLYSSKDLVPCENRKAINLPTPKDKTMTLYNFGS